MRPNIYKIGYWSGLIAFAFAVSFVVVQLLQVLGILNFPWDEILIYSTSLGIVFPFVIAMLTLHYATPVEKKFWSHGGLLFTLLYSFFVTANYVVQLATVLPHKMNGTIDVVALLDQTPHSVFWDYDALGYIFMGLAMLMAVPVFEKKSFQKWVRLAFILNFLVTPLISFVYFYPGYSNSILMLGLPWAITAPGAMLMLALFFKKQNRENFQKSIALKEKKKSPAIV